MKATVTHETAASVNDGMNQIELARREMAQKLKLDPAAVAEIEDLLYRGGGAYCCEECSNVRNCLYKIWAAVKEALS